MLVVIHTPALEVLLIRRVDDAPMAKRSGSRSRAAKTRCKRIFGRRQCARCRRKQASRPMHRAAYCATGGWKMSTASIPNGCTLCARCAREHRAHLQPGSAGGTIVQLNPREHRAWQWLPWRQAAWPAIRRPMPKPVCCCRVLQASSKPAGSWLAVVVTRRAAVRGAQRHGAGLAFALLPQNRACRGRSALAAQLVHRCLQSSRLGQLIGGAQQQLLRQVDQFGV